MSVDRSRFELANRDGEPIRGDLWLADDARPRAVIVICHGFKGFKDWGFFPYLGEQLARRTGYAAVTFNFSGNGIGPDLLNFTELDKFERNTFSKELDDLGVILGATEAGELPGLGPCRSFGLFGHSRGGVSAIVTGLEDPRVASLVTWSAVARLDRWSDELKADWRRTGRFEVLNTRTKQMMPLGLGLLEDVERNAERFDLLKAAARLKVPYLIVHGSDDESVALSEAEALAAAAPAARFERVDGAGHTFGAVHPFQGTTDHLTQAIELTAEWYVQHLDR